MTWSQSSDSAYLQNTAAAVRVALMGKPGGRIMDEAKEKKRNEVSRKAKNPTPTQPNSGRERLSVVSPSPFFFGLCCAHTYFPFYFNKVPKKWGRERPTVSPSPIFFWTLLK